MWDEDDDRDWLDGFLRWLDDHGLDPLGCALIWFPIVAGAVAFWLVTVIAGR